MGRPPHAPHLATASPLLFPGAVAGAAGDAWDRAWDAVRLGDYAGAARWFETVRTTPPDIADRWAAARETMMAHCRDLAGPPGAGAPTPDRTAGGPLPVLSVASLGRTGVTRGGEALPGGPGRKAGALFRYLLVRPDRAAHKDELVELGWPDSPPREGEHSLHVAIAALRRYLDPPGARPHSYLLFEAGRYRLNPDAPVEEDRERFDRLTAGAGRAWQARDADAAWRLYTEALPLYRGDYQADPREPVWVLVERERLLTRYLRALDHLARLAIARGGDDLAAEHYLALLARDPYREDAHAQLVRCYLRLGRRHDALRQYDRCAALLRDDLGLEPAPELRALRRTIAHTDPKSTERSGPCWDHQVPVWDLDAAAVP